MDVTEIAQSLRSFIVRHGTQFTKLSRSETQLLEIAALILTAEHYRRSGFTVTVQNKVHNRFKVKVSARGYPFNFSSYLVAKPGQQFEIHGNLAVRSAYGKDGGIYVVDVGVVNANKIPSDNKKRKEWEAMENAHLLTFVEAKKLVIYPMLLAQFYGIVHEVKPNFLRRNFVPQKCHFNPSLVCVGYLSGTSGKIRDGFRQRGFHVNVIPAFDERVSQLAHDPNFISPFSMEEPEEEEAPPPSISGQVVSKDDPSLDF